MIIRENKADIVAKRHKANEVEYQGKNITIRIDLKTLEDFKSVCDGRPYQTVLKEVMRDYIYRKQVIYKQEEDINKRMLG